MRLSLYWNQVAPLQLPPNFQADDPAHPAYRWADFDRQVELAVANGLEPYVTVNKAPLWAQDHADNDRRLPDWRVDPVEFGRFGLAAARRYSGLFSGLPRIRYWEAWNEPNLDLYLNPQLAYAASNQRPRPYDPDKVVSADLYRDLLNRFSAAVHEVHRDNVVIAGALAPFGGLAPRVAVSPLRFMRKLLCMSEGRNPRPVCTKRVQFDVWSTHPYTSGNAFHSAFKPDDVSLGDLPEMQRILRAAERAGQIVTRRRVGFWITEFSWDSKPPDTRAVPIRLLARWVAEALYRAWSLDVTTFTWYQFRDGRKTGPDRYVAQSGFYLRGGDRIERDRAKYTLTAFRFPFVAYRTRGGIFVWGRTPASASARLTIERLSRRGWVSVASLPANRQGIFMRTLRNTPGGHLLRARLAGRRVASLPFSLRRPPDLPVHPFGG